MEQNEANIIESGYFKSTPHYNTEEWRQAALHFEEFGMYTKYPPNSHSSSKYYKFWEEEARRSIYGYNIGRDWIPGYFYWYLNYAPIYLAVEIKEEDAIAGNVEALMQQAQADREWAFPDFWDGDYEYYHYLEEAERAGEHGAVLKTRGRGYSFKGGGMCNRNYYLIPGSKSYVFADEKEYLLSDGLLTKAWEMMDHVEQQTPWGKRRQRHDGIMHKRSSYYQMVGGRKIEKGFKSEIIGVTLKNNWNKARGKRGKLILYEESGKNPHLLKAWNISLKSMQQGRLTFGLQVAFGTGGTEDVDIMGLEQLFYEGGAYNVHMVPNIWDDAASNGRCGHFASVEQNLEGAMDKDGNSIYEISKKLTDASRDHVIKSTKNPETIIRFIAEEPRKPQEAIMRLGGTIFPINDLKAHLNHLRSAPADFEELEYVGKLELDEETEKYKWKLDPTAKPIRIFPQTDKRNIEGAIVIYEHPVANSEGIIPYGVYLAGNDTYDHDESTTDSLGSTFIMNKLTERIVAEYTGRPNTANGYYENVRRLLLYYNAKCNYENNWKGLFTYLNSRHHAHLLCDTPKIVHDKIYDKSVLNRGAGTPGTVPIQKWGRELILIWLTTAVAPGSERLNLHTIRSIPLLQELIYWYKDGNFDRVDALQMLMIYKEDVQNIIPEEEQQRAAVPEFFSRMEMFQEKMTEKNDPFAVINKRMEIERRHTEN